MPPVGAPKEVFDAYTIPSSTVSLITSILSAGTFFGAIIAADIADWYGRRTTIISGCIIYIVGVILQTAYDGQLGLIVTGRLIAGFGVGFVSAIIILYMSEIAPRKVRGAIVSGYQFVSDRSSFLTRFATVSTKGYSPLTFRPLPSVFCSHLASSMVLKTDETLRHTEFPSLSNSHGL